MLFGQLLGEAEFVGVYCLVGVETDTSESQQVTGTGNGERFVCDLFIFLSLGYACVSI